MADELPTPAPSPNDPVQRPAPEAEAKDAAAEETPDYLFRLQLAISSFFSTNSRYLGYLAGAGLAGVLVWGLWEVWQERSANEAYGAIATIDYKMPKPDPMSRYGLAPADDPNDAGRMADLKQGAKLFEDAARGSSGSAAAYAYLKAADAWERAGDTDARLAALKAGYAAGGGDLPTWSLGAAYAGALSDAGRAEEALGVYREIAGKTQGFYAQQALMALAGAQIDLGKNDDARATIQEFKTRFPNASPERVAALEVRTGQPTPSAPAGASAAPAAPATPAETPAAPAAPPAGTPG